MVSIQYILGIAMELSNGKADIKCRLSQKDGSLVCSVFVPGFWVFGNVQEAHGTSLDDAVRNAYNNYLCNKKSILKKDIVELERTVFYLEEKVKRDQEQLQISRNKLALIEQEEKNNEVG